MSRRHAALLSAALLAAVALHAPAAHAHRLAPSFLELVESDAGVSVLWKTPRVVSRGGQTEPVIPCPPASEHEHTLDGTAFIARWTLDCSGVPLVGARLAVTGLEASGTDALVHIALADGRQIRTILTAESPSYTIPPREEWTRVARSYLMLGMEHLFGGMDHVLFVLGLLGLLGATRRLALAITSFTLGHSLTLALAALGLVSVPPAPVEVGIAMTIVVLAVELARGDADSPLQRRPGTMPFAFGLLHGLGFAGALRALGLPQDAIPLTLFSFNVGIELGQLAIVALALPLLVVAGRALRRAAGEGTRWQRLAMELPATAIGSLGVYWGLQRTADWLLG